MGLNWAAALENFSKGFGQIAQVKYSEFMRQDENKRREKEREIDFQRQKNLARFNVNAQRALQSDSFAHTEKIENARIDAQKLRDQADSEYRMESLSNQRAQINASAASAAAQARADGARLKMLEDQAGYAKADRELQQQLSVYKIPMEAAQAQLDGLMKNRTELIKQGADTSALDAQAMDLRQTITKAVDGQVGFMIQSGHIKMAPDALERYNSLEGQGISRLQMLERAMNPVLEAEPAAVDQNQFIPSGGNRGLPGQDGSAPAPEPVSQDEGPGVVDRTLDNMGKAASMAATPFVAAGEAVLDAGNAASDYFLGSNELQGPSKQELEMALRKLDPRTVEKFKAGGQLSAFEEQQVGELGYKPEHFRSLLQRGGYLP